MPMSVKIAYNCLFISGYGRVKLQATCELSQPMGEAPHSTCRPLSHIEGHCCWSCGNHNIFCYINVIFMWCTLFECLNGFYAIGMCAVFTRLSVLTVIIFCSFLTTVYLSCSSWILALSCQGSDMHFLWSQLVSGEDKMNVQRSGSFPTLQKNFSNHCWNRGVTS